MTATEKIDMMIASQLVRATCVSTECNDCPMQNGSFCRVNNPLSWELPYNVLDGERRTDD